MGSILVDQLILKRISEQKLIENHDRKCVQPVSYDLRVGSFRDKQTNHRIDLVKGEEIAIRPLGFLLVGTVEQVNVPNDLIGMMYLLSSYTRLGFVPYFQGIVDPGYRGHLTIMLHNLSGDLVPIKGEEPICHLVFEQLSQPVEKGYEGAYQDSPGATPPLYPPTVKIVGETIWKVPE